MTNGVPRSKKTAVIGPACQTKSMLIDALDMAFGFPEHAARNLDALYDVLTTDIEGPLRIEWVCPPDTRAAFGHDFPRIRAVLEAAAQARPDLELAIGDGFAEGQQADAEVAAAGRGRLGGEQVEPLFAKEVIAARVEALARDIAGAMGEEFTIVGLLKGAFVFTADLVRALDAIGCRPEVEFLQVSSYGLGSESSGHVKTIGGLPTSVEGRKILLVDDIQDSGRTLAYTRDLLIEHGAALVRICTLLDKPSRRVVEIEPDFTGFVIPDVFVVGYGIDYAERWRHLPFIGKVTGV